jgi:hypothetical protein
MTDHNSLQRELPFLQKLIKFAQAQVPPVKYAAGLLGFIAVAAIALGILGRGTAAMISVGSVLCGMVLLFVFAKLTRSNSKQIQTAGLVLMWVIVGAFVIFVVFTVTSVAIGEPKFWAKLLGLQSSELAPRPTVSVALLKRPRSNFNNMLRGS